MWRRRPDSPWNTGLRGRPWRRRREAVLVAFGDICQLCGKPIDRTKRAPHPLSATVHHLRGKRFGDGLEQLVAAHWACNMAAGDPSKAEPAIKRRTRW